MLYSKKNTAFFIVVEQIDFYLYKYNDSQAFHHKTVLFGCLDTIYAERT